MALTAKQHVVPGKGLAAFPFKLGKPSWEGGATSVFRMGDGQVALTWALNKQWGLRVLTLHPQAFPRLTSPSESRLCSPPASGLRSSTSLIVLSLSLLLGTQQRWRHSNKVASFFISGQAYLEIFTTEVLMEPACSCQNVWLTCWFSNNPLLLRFLKAFPNIFPYLWGYNLLVSFLVC